MFKPSPIITIEGRNIGEDFPTYFIADIAANHDGDLNKAIDLIHLAKEAGADAAKFQHFKAETIVSDTGFKSLNGQQSHQKNWDKSVFDVYKGASVSKNWTKTLKEACDKVGIHFFTSPYDFDLVDHIDPYVPAYKIGSGDITWTEIIEYVAAKGKPYIIASGASTMDDVHHAVSAGLAINDQLVLLQCNTNYTGSVENMRYIQLNVLKSYRAMYPNMILGLSDHTPGHATVLGAVTLGARIIEKHFTDNINQKGPDHKFSLDPVTWKEMVERTRELEAALGNGIKKVEENELETVVLQRRSIRLTRTIQKGEEIKESDLSVLRPAPEGSLPPNMLQSIIGKVMKKSVDEGQHITLADFA